MSDKQTVKFGDICREVKLTTKDPIADGYERYIGLEHLDSGSLKIKRWGMIAEDNPSFTRVFKKGHILFGKRRPYLRKAAIAEFDGICSGDIIVLESCSDLIETKLIPFIVQSEQMWNWAIKTSSGSLSPRTKFKTLSELEIVLHSPNEQQRLLSMLSKIQTVEDRLHLAINSLNMALKNFKDSIKNLDDIRLLHPKRIIEGNLESFVQFSSGKSKIKSEISQFQNESECIPVYGGNGITGYTNEYLLGCASVVVGRVGEYCGCVHKTQAQAWITDNALYPKWMSDVLSLEYLFVLLDCLNLNQYKSRSGQPLVSQKALAPIPVKVPSKDDQVMICEAYKDIDEAIKLLDLKLEKNRNLKSAVLASDGGV
ncbi:restriction endonuclease subunit S [Vibrio parahaemolyticus]